MIQISEVDNFKAHNFLADLPEGAKPAIVMAHFGTTHQDTRIKTIDAINALVSNAYPDIEVREAYTSRIILKRLFDRKTPKPSLPETLTQLAHDGYTHLVVQPTVIIDGVEMRSIRCDVESHATLFTDIRIGTPLLFHPDDYRNLVRAMTRNYTSDKAYLWVGHGTYDSSTAQYAMLDYLLRHEAQDKHVYVGTIEGFPTLDDVTQELLAHPLRKLTIVPLMFVAGEHAKKDIAQEWREHFDALGFDVDILLEGMGEDPIIQELYLNKLRHAIEYKQWDIMQKKAIYTVTGEKME